MTAFDGDWKSPARCEAHLRGLRGWVLGWRGRGGTALKRNLRVAMIEPEKVKALFFPV